MSQAVNRYRFVPLFVDDTTQERFTYYGTRDPEGYRDDSDTTTHLIKRGETLQSLAAHYYRGFEEPATLWWVIADFQPTPILDPTRRLEPGTLLQIPSAALVSELINTRVIDRIP